MKNNLPGFTPVNWSDHEFAAYLQKKDKDWKAITISTGSIGWSHYLSKDKIIAVVKYKNTEPIDRWIWIPISETNIIFNKEKS